MSWEPSSHGAFDNRSRGAAGWQDRSRGKKDSWGGGGWNDHSRGEEASPNEETWKYDDGWKGSGGSVWSESHPKRDHGDVREVKEEPSDSQYWKGRLGDDRQLRPDAFHWRDNQLQARAQPPPQTAAAAVADAPQQPQQSPPQTAPAAVADEPQQPQQSPPQAAVQPNAAPPILSMYPAYQW